MTSTQRTAAPRYLTLRDYLRVLRRYRIMIALLAIIGAATGFASGAGKQPVYQATAVVDFQDPNQAISLVGFGSSTAKSPAQIAALNADTVTGTAVMSEVKRRLRTPLSLEELSRSLAAQADPNSGLLSITAVGSTPGSAARLANTVASTLVAQDNRQTRAEFAQVAAELRRRIGGLSHSPAATAPGGPMTFYQDELARMNTLGAFATSAQLATLAQPPAAASSPSRIRGVLLGLALGLLMGIAVAFLRDSLDRRLRHPQDIESSFQLPLLGHVGKRSMGKTAYAASGSRGGHEADLEPFRILRRRLELLDHQSPPRSILITSAVSDEGKTTVAGSLAFAMAAAGKRTLLVDCDLRRPALARRLGVEEAPGISEYLADAASPEQILRKIEFSEPPSPNGAAPRSTNGHGTATPSHQLVFIPAGSSTPRAGELLSSSRLREFIDQVTGAYDAVVIDSGPLLPVADTLELLPHVDAIVVCVRESRTTQDQALAARAALGRFAQGPSGVVVTGVKPGAEYAHSYGYG